MTLTERDLGAREIPKLGRIGVWSMELRGGDASEQADAAAELEALGFGAIWIPGATDNGLLQDVSRLLTATGAMQVATGILNMWKHEAGEVGAWWRALSGDHRARCLLGLGVSHAAAIGAAYAKPLGAMKEYLALLSAQGVPAARLCLAALGPKMLELARDQTAGAHPYLVTPEHTARARAVLGQAPLLATEQGVVLETNAARARDLARPYVSGYGRLANYANNWRRLGFSDDDIANASDRLVDALFVWGGVEKIAARVNAHFDAGADHVCLQVVGVSEGIPSVAAMRPAWRELAQILL